MVLQALKARDLVSIFDRNHLWRALLSKWSNSAIRRKSRTFAWSLYDTTSFQRRHLSTSPL